MVASRLLKPILSSAVPYRSLEVSIVSTSLTTMTYTLYAFGNGIWAVIAYQLTYIGVHAHSIPKQFAESLVRGFFIIWGNFNDKYGRKILWSKWSSAIMDPIVGAQP